jgi:hypothetical protein
MQINCTKVAFGRFSGGDYGPDWARESKLA